MSRLIVHNRWICTPLSTYDLARLPKAPPKLTLTSALRFTDHVSFMDRRTFLARFGVQVWSRTNEDVRMMSELLKQSQRLCNPHRIFAGGPFSQTKLLDPKERATEWMKMWACLGGHMVPGLFPVYISCKAPQLVTSSLHTMLQHIIGTTDSNLCYALEKQQQHMLLMLDHWNEHRWTTRDDHHPCDRETVQELERLQESRSGRVFVIYASKL